MLAALYLNVCVCQVRLICYLRNSCPSTTVLMLQSFEPGRPRIYYIIDRLPLHLCIDGLSMYIDKTLFW